jgi:hypothetical protein
MPTDRRAELSEKLGLYLRELARTTHPQARDVLHVMIERVEWELEPDEISGRAPVASASFSQRS